MCRPTRLRRRRCVGIQPRPSIRTSCSLWAGVTGSKCSPRTTTSAAPVRCRPARVLTSLETHEWTEVPESEAAPCPRLHHGAVLVGTQVVVFGGTNGDKDFYNDTFLFNVGVCPCRFFVPAARDVC